MILDLQEAVLAEGLHLLEKQAQAVLGAPAPAPGTPEALLPPDLLSAGAALKVWGGVGWGRAGSRPWLVAMCALTASQPPGQLVLSVGFCFCIARLGVPIGRTKCPPTHTWC